jgi:hypothetical protein
MTSSLASASPALTSASTKIRLMSCPPRARSQPHARSRSDGHKESMQQLADKFGFGFRRVGVRAIASNAAIHPSHQTQLCSPIRVHLRVGPGHAEAGKRFKALPERGVSTARAGAKSKSSGVVVNSVLT